MKTIEIIISSAGEISIDAVGFRGADCERATAYFEKALGVVNKKVKKPDYTRQNLRQQKVGQ